MVQQQGPTIPATSDSFDVGDPSDALESDFTIGTSAIRGNDWGFFVDTFLLGYDPFTQLTYTNNVSGDTFSIREVDLMYKPIGKTTQFVTGIE